MGSSEQIEAIKKIAFYRLRIIGPFDNQDGNGLERTYPPEQEVNFSTSYRGKNGPVEWQGWSREEDDEPFAPLGELLGEADEAIGYALTYVYCRRATEAILIVSGASVGYINSQEVFRHDTQSDLGQAQVQKTVQLRHGWSSILIKSLSPESGEWSLWAGLMTPGGESVPELRVRTGFFGKGPDEDQSVQVGDPATEWRRSNPDVVVYIPKEGDHNDGDNEHFLVFESSKSQDLLAMWTQGTVEAHGDNHIVLARSKDGVTWSEPKWIIGTHPGTREHQASWGFPLACAQGRLYCFYTKAEAGVPGGHSEIMGRLYSDDDGETWIEGPDLVVPKHVSDPNSEEQDWFIVWQKPFRDSKGRWMAGYSGYPEASYFMRFDNIDEGPDIEDMKITWLPLDGKGLSLANYIDDESRQDIDPVEMLQATFSTTEPSVVVLPDGRLFTTFRTRTGRIWYTVSSDDGESWRKLEILCYRDKGEPFKHPLTCCPIYQLKDGRYLLLFHNNDYFASTEKAGLRMPDGMGVFSHRRPAFITVGEFRPDAHQPIWFGKHKQILDTDGVIVSLKGTNEIATYTSFTIYKGKQILWYPDRKYYLLGKYITDEILADMNVD